MFTCFQVHDILHFFPQTSENEIEFLYASEKSGYRHLYVIKSQLSSPGSWVKVQHMGQGDVAGKDICLFDLLVTLYLCFSIIFIFIIIINIMFPTK